MLCLLDQSLSNGSYFPDFETVDGAPWQTVEDLYRSLQTSLKNRHNYSQPLQHSHPYLFLGQTYHQYQEI